MRLSRGIGGQNIDAGRAFLYQEEGAGGGLPWQALMELAKNRTLGVSAWHLPGRFH